MSFDLKPDVTKQLLKILIGAAWIDGSLQPEESAYLDRIAREKGLADDPEVQSLLSKTEPVEPAQCYRWLETYLGTRPKQEDYYHLLEAISALIYSDNEVEPEEAQLLSQLQSFSPTNRAALPTFEQLLKGIKKLYRQSLTR